jgi:dolichol-phosphate mannosyltransferase
MSATSTSAAAGLDPARLIQMAAREKVNDRYWSEEDPISQLRCWWRAQTIRNIFHLLPGESILELACGSGTLTKPLLRATRMECPITAATFVAGFADKLHQQAPTVLSTRLLTDFPGELKDQTFDYVVGTNLLDAKNASDVLKAVQGLLKPGGRLLLFESNPWNPVFRLRYMLSRFLPFIRRGDERRLPNQVQLYELLSELGYVRVTATHYDFLFRPIPRFLMRLMRNLTLVLENTPGVRRLAGTILVHGQKPPKDLPRPAVVMAEHLSLRAAVSVVVPCHNEEMNVGPLYESLRQYYDPYICEFVLVDDNSTDSTAAVLRELAAKDPRVKPVFRKPPNGVGHALRDGLRAASGQYVLLMDCDFTQILPELRDMFDRAAQGADVVVGSRFSRESVLINYPIQKIVCNRSFHVLANLAFRRRLRDFTNNLKLLKREVVDNLEIEAAWFAANAETGLKPLLMGYKVVPSPISWINRTPDMGQSSFSLLKNGVEYAKVLLTLVWKTRFGSRLLPKAAASASAAESAPSEKLSMPKYEQSVAPDSGVVSENPRRSALIEYLQGIALTNVLFLFVIVAIGTALFVTRNHLHTWVAPLAGAITVLAIFLFSSSGTRAAVLTITFITSHLAAYAVAGYFMDGSWDGLAYHQEAVLRLAAGWNPFFESAGAYSIGHEIWNDHFPKAAWIGSAAIFLTTGQIEPGKLWHYTLMLAAGCQVAAVMLRLTRLKTLPIIAIAALAALNPVSIYQSSCFYVDGLLASLLTSAIAALVLYLFARDWRALLVALLCACLIGNLKFTGLLYAVLILGAGVLASWYLRGFRSAARFATFSAITGAVAVFIIGYSPYVRNMREHGGIFYPMYGRNAVDFTAPMRPVNVADKDRFSRFFIANMSRSEFVHPPNSTRLKFPFSIGIEEKFAWGADPESGAFGPLYGGLLLVTIATAVWLLSSSAIRRAARVPLLVAAFLVLTIFSHTEGWWGRYAPQAWLLPLVVGLGCLLAARRKLQWSLGFLLIALAAINMLYVSYHFAQHEWSYTRNMRESLKEMSQAGEPVKVYLGEFPSLRERFREHHIAFQVIDKHPPTGRGRESWHAIPPDQAYWFADHLHPRAVSSH